MPIEPRPMVLQTELDVHGSARSAELEALGIDPTALIDFSSNINPHGPAPAVVDAVRAAQFAAYPDPDCLALRRALAAQHRVDVEQIMVGNGTAELIWLLAFAYLVPGDSVAILGPTFGEYARAARLCSVSVEMLHAKMKNDFAVEIGAVERLLSHKPTLFFICNPNNPTGYVLPIDVIERWANENPYTLFVVDEAYIDFVPNMQSALSLSAHNVLVLRSMTKAHALAGLRIGYAVGSKKVAHALRQVQPPWSVNALAQAAGAAALEETDFVQKSLGRLARDAAELRTALTMVGYSPLPGVTPYFLIDVGDGAALRLKLLEHELMVRDCASFGLPQYVRVSTQLVDQNVRLVGVLKQL